MTQMTAVDEFPPANMPSNVQQQVSPVSLGAYLERMDGDELPKTQYFVSHDPAHGQSSGSNQSPGQANQCSISVSYDMELDHSLWQRDTQLLEHETIDFADNGGSFDIYMRSLQDLPQEGERIDEQESLLITDEQRLNLPSQEPYKHGESLQWSVIQSRLLGKSAISTYQSALYFTQLTSATY
ncbi:hypothetical protein ACEPAG_3625 [Sanghuangporus baumii]